MYKILSSIDPYKAILTEMCTPQHTSCMLTLQSFGAAGTVTGSLHVFTYTHNNHTFRFGIDAGMFQTGEMMSEIMLNAQLGFEPSTVDSWILTHAHLDHTGRLAYVVKRGFKGPIYTTQVTQSLANIVMTDATKQMANHYRTVEQEEYTLIQDGKLPQHSYERKDIELYNTADVDETNRRFEQKEVGQSWEICPNLEITFYEASHILGSIYLRIKEISTGKTVYHSADIGYSPKPFLKKITTQTSDESVCSIIMESTYGDRLHNSVDPKPAFAKQLKETLSAGGQVIIPAFAIQRSQELMYYCKTLMESGQIPTVDIYLDSPMAINASEVYANNNEDARNTLASSRVKQLVSAEQSKELNYITEPCVIIAGSGMMNGGRIWQHLRFHGHQSKNCLLIVGFQAPGTHGRAVLEGEKNFVIDHKDIHIGLKVVKLEGFSGHADQAMLTKWLTDIVPQSVYRGEKPLNVILIHGEDSSRTVLAEVIQNKIKSPTLKVHLPKPAQEFTLID
jgi:metallo-beta-lactamase family protein